MQDFKIRASAVGQIMSNPRSKKDLLSKTAATYVEDWLKEKIYGTKKNINTKQIQKGILLEDEAIDSAINWLDLEFAIKNEKHFENEFMTGTPDLILEDEIIDTKVSWDEWTFPLFAKELPEKSYFYQMQAYMHLTGKKKGRVVYVLLNTPEHLDPYNEHPDYSNLDKKYRIKTFEVVYDPNVIEEIENRVDEIRAYIEKSLKYK